MKILVIGGAGHVGSEVIKALKKRDAEVRVLVRKPEVKPQPGIETVVGDLLDRCFASRISRMFRTSLQNSPSRVRSENLTYHLRLHSRQDQRLDYEDRHYWSHIPPKFTRQDNSLRVRRAAEEAARHLPDEEGRDAE